MAGPYDFTDQNIENTYQRVLQTPDGVTFYDGTGSLVTLPSGTPTFPYTGSAIISGSLTITGSLNAPSITGSLLGTASWAYSSSQAITASYALNGGVTSVNVAGTGLSINQTTGAVVITGTGGGGGGNTSTGSYGSFYHTGSQTATSATTIYSMSLSTTDISNGVYVSGPSRSRIYVTDAGVYDFQFSAQFRNTDTSDEQHVAIWIRKNNISSANDIVDSNSFISVPKAKGGNPGEIIAAWNFFLQLAAGDFIELLWHAEVANKITLETIAAGTNPVHPRTPALIVTANRVDQFLSNTGSFTGSFTGQLIGTASWANNYNETDPIFVEKSASLATTGSNTFIGDQIITGSVYITGSLNADAQVYEVSFLEQTSPPYPSGDNVIILDQDLITNPNYTRNTNTITVNSYGSYRIYAQNRIHVASGVQGDAEMAIFINNNPYRTYYIKDIKSSDMDTYNFSCVANLNTNDTIEFHINSNTQPFNLYEFSKIYTSVVESYMTIEKLN